VLEFLNCNSVRCQFIQSEAKNFDKENLHCPKIDRLVYAFAFECNSTVVFLRTLILHTTQNQKAQFPRSIERKCSVLFSLVFPWRNG
jgi:hypothetical protein